MIRWLAKVGGVYRVQSAVSVRGNWVTRAEMSADVESMSWSDEEVAGVATRFYRVVALEEADCVTAGNGLSPEGRALLAGDSVPFLFTETFESSRQVAAEAVFGASQLAGLGEFIAFGTLTQQPDLQWLYNAEPQDRMVILFHNQQSIEVWVEQMVGDLSFNATHFLDSNHTFRWRSFAEGIADINFSSVRNGRIIESSAKGNLFFQAVSYAIDLAALTDSFFESDTDGAHLITDSTVTGTMTADGYLLEANRRTRFEFISTRNLTTGVRESASFAQNWLNDKLTLGNDVYQWVGVQRFTNLKDGKPSRIDDNDHWKSQGVLLKNNEAYGVYRKNANPVGASAVILTFDLHLPEETIEMQSWTITAMSN